MIGISGAKAQAPVANFSASTTSGCGPLGVNFTDLSTGSPLYWTWDFGNGQISSLQNPIATYTIPGVYTVTLIVKNKDGENSIRMTNYITVYPYPSASFTSNLTLACAPANIQFTDQSVPGQGAISSWNWDFGDGATNTQPSPPHTYSQPGYYSVRLTVTNSQGCSNSLLLVRYIRVVSGIQPDFSWSQTTNSCSAPFALNFTNQTAGPGTLSYSWNLGNGTITGQTSPSTIYPANTSYSVSLTAQSNLGCSGTTTKTISFPAANPVITSPDTACTNNPIAFVNGSSPVPVSSSWNFGDGTAATVANPGKTYPTAATYAVKLVNTYATCLDSVIKSIVVINNPVPDFTADKQVTCQAPFTVNFTAVTAPGDNVKSYSWDFGDGGTSTSANPAHTYTTTGSFDVRLTVTGSSGCPGTVTKSQFIQIAAPTVTIDLLPGQVCIGQAFRPLADISTLDGVKSYSWTAPGATPSSSTLPNPTFIYAGEGNYNLTLSVTTNDGCVTPAILFSNAAVVGDSIPAVFTYSQPTPCANQPITFSSSSDSVNYWFWYFGDGDTGRTASPIIHAYSDSGNLAVRLSVIHHGCTTISQYQTVHINAPIANFGYKPECANRLIVDFFDSSKVNPGPGAPVYTFYYGDGSPPVTVTSYPPIFPSHTYLSFNTYKDTLIVSNGGCTDTIVKSVIVSPQAPDFTVSPGNDSVCRNAPFVLTAVGIDTSFIKTYSWTVGATTTPGGFSFTSTDTANGSYPLSLTVTDINGCIYPSIAPHTLIVIGPTANFTMAGTGTPGGCRNSPILFNDHSTAYPGYPITQWIWNFGDDSLQTFTAPPYSHSYADTGYYPVFLTAHDAYGCEDTYSFYSVQITGPQTGFFTRDTFFYCPNEPLPFTDSSKGYSLSWLWDFGDGSPASTIQNPSHNFPTSGQKYSIKLKVTDQTGCSDSLTKLNYITIQSPIPAFTISDSTTICPPLQTTFTPNPQYYDSLYWDFGDGTTSTLANTTHFYNSYDTFYAKLVLRGPGGCLDSATRRIFVLNPGPSTSFTYSPLTHCDSINTNFTIVPPDFTRWTLYFGDGQTDSTEAGTVSHEYRGPFVYSPQLILTDSTGCIVPIGALGGNITVLGATPFFSVDKHAFCDSGTVNFTDFTITNDAIVSKIWVYGDGNSYTSPTPAVDNPTSNDYMSPGNYLATIKVATQSNCAENYTDTIRVYQTPHPIITVGDPPCVNSPVTLDGSLVIPDIDSVSWNWNFGDGQTSQQQDPGVIYISSGQYTISLRTSVSFGCADTVTRTITVNPLPSIKGPAQIVTPVGFPVTIPFTYSINTVSYFWTPVINLSCADCSNPTATDTFSTLYKVMATDSNHCVNYDSIYIKTICDEKNYYIPNTFSPNGDGINDVFYPRGRSLYNIQSMRIFNRWGQKVFEKRDFPANTQSEGWDGTFNGRPAAVDAYVYIIEVVCENAQIIALKGDVTLIR